MLKMWGATKNEYAVLSTYVTDIATLGVNVNNRWEVPHLCQSLWTDRGMVRNQQASSAINLESPILAPLWSAGFSFSKCHAEVKVPNDPSLPMIFEGEEFSKFARLWTRGYDVYTPSRTLIGHDYKHVLAEQVYCYVRGHVNWPHSAITYPDVPTHSDLWSGPVPT